MESMVASIADRPPPQPGVFATTAYAQIHAWVVAYPEYELEQLLSRGDTLAGRLRRARDRLTDAVQTAERLLAGGTVTRPSRRMPPMLKIANHHGLGERPHCVGCGYLPPCETWIEAASYLERAHIIDRWAGGLDGPQNLAPLCGPCHRGQPIFEPGDEEMAIHWFGLGATLRCPQLTGTTPDV